jgi:pimeloyl-ACP methyl ester carboxylesterase
MPTIQRGDATIYYEEQGTDVPLLLLAPGGLNSTVDFWSRMPLNPLAAFGTDGFRIIAMDQRNAGRSSGPLDSVDAWKMYAEDQLAVLDHLGIDQFMAMGSCIGCSFIFELIEQAPRRIVAGVLMQPIGHDETNDGAFGPEMWTPWGQNLIDKGAHFNLETLHAFGHSLFDPGFVFSVSREFLKATQTPLLLLYGSDRAHPRGVSVEVAGLLPNLASVERWREPDAVPEATERIRTFLKTHSTASSRA